MNYGEWGREYLQEAALLKRHLGPLRKALRLVTGQNAILLYRRVSILNTMYLECLHTGRELVKRGEKFETRAESES